MSSARHPRRIQPGSGSRARDRSPGSGPRAARPRARPSRGQKGPSGRAGGEAGPGRAGPFGRETSASCGPIPPAPGSPVPKPGTRLPGLGRGCEASPSLRRGRGSGASSALCGGGARPGRRAALRTRPGQRERSGCHGATPGAAMEPPDGARSQSGRGGSRAGGSGRDPQPGGGSGRVLREREGRGSWAGVGERGLWIPDRAGRHRRRGSERSQDRDRRSAPGRPGGEIPGSPGQRRLRAGPAVPPLPAPAGGKNSAGWRKNRARAGKKNQLLKLKKNPKN